MKYLSSYIELTRLNKPIGIWLLFLPCLFGQFLAIKILPNVNFWEMARITFLFFLGSIVMRSAGCVINDLFDRKFDEKVARTKSRPLASGEIKRSDALILLAILLCFGLTILLQFNSQVILSGVFALGLVITYPLMKRFTNYPQIFLGVTFNFGILMGFLAVFGTLTLSSLLLYASAILWTVIYDTIYAYQDIEDDLKIGVKSTAIRFALNPKRTLFLIGLVMLSLLIIVGWRHGFKMEFFLAILLADLFLTNKIQNCDFKNPENCLKVFKSNFWVGALILLAIILG